MTFVLSASHSSDSPRNIRLVTKVNKYRLFQFNKLTVLQLSGQTCLLEIMFTLYKVNGKGTTAAWIMFTGKDFWVGEVLVLHVSRYLLATLNMLHKWTVCGAAAATLRYHSDQWNWLHQAWEQRINGLFMDHRDPLSKCKNRLVFYSYNFWALSQWEACLQTAAI